MYQGDEVLFLPTIVESAVASPSAAKECASVLRKLLSKENYKTPNIQYNAIMLIRILADNPGKTFTRNFDTKFVKTVKDLLQFARDPSVKQIMLECLNAFQTEKSDDEGLKPLMSMWEVERTKMYKVHVSTTAAMSLAKTNSSKGAPQNSRTTNAANGDPNSQNYFARNHHSHRLPNPTELASRVEEAQTSAKLLIQVVQSTPPSELSGNDLIKEFADRCQSASKSIQAYMSAENPSPDNATMETLIETNEMLGKAMTTHHRAALQARKIMGVENDAALTTHRISESYAPPAGPPPADKKPAIALWRKAVKPGAPVPPVPPPGDYAPTNISDDEEGNPFSDRNANGNGKSAAKAPPFPFDKPSTAAGQFHDTLGVEPFHPGFSENRAEGSKLDTQEGKGKEMNAAPKTRREVLDSASESEGEVGESSQPAAPTQVAPLTGGTDSPYRY